MPHVSFVTLSGFRVHERELLEYGMTLPGFHDRGRALAELPALGLLTLAGVLPEDWTCSYRAPELVNDELTDAVAAESPDLVAVSALTASIEDAYQFSDGLRRRGVNTVLGGLHVTACPDEAGRHADAVVIGSRHQPLRAEQHDQSQQGDGGAADQFQPAAVAFLHLPLAERDDDQRDHHRVVEHVGWTLDKEKAKQKGGKPIPLGKDGRPSEANHGNVTPTFADGGVTFEQAVQTTVISLPALRRLRFPLTPGEKSDPKVDDAARTVLAALGLCAAALTRESGCDLRSRCQLFPTLAIVWELLDKPGTEPEQFELSGDDAVNLFNEAVDAAKLAGLPWMDEELTLSPSPELVGLVKKSQELATSVGVEED